MTNPTPAMCPVHITAFGEISMLSAVYFRAMRLQRKYGRDAVKYLDEWAEYQYLNGRDVVKMPETQRPKGTQ